MYEAENPWYVTIQSDEKTTLSVLPGDEVIMVSGADSWHHLTTLYSDLVDLRPIANAGDTVQRYVKKGMTYSNFIGMSCLRGVRKKFTAKNESMVMEMLILLMVLLLSNTYKSAESTSLFSTTTTKTAKTYCW